MNKESKYRTVGVVAVIGGICISFGWKYVSGPWKKKADTQLINLPRSMSLAAIHGGKLALDRLVDYQNFLGKQATQVDAIQHLETLFQNQQPNFKEIQQVLGRLELSRREDGAIKLLKKALKRAEKRGKSNDAYEIGMLLVEMHIYKGDVKKALKCKCLAAEAVSDARPSLYKAIISLMDQREEDGLQHWQKFKETQDLTTLSGFHDEEEFTQFRNAVSLLKQDIDAATQVKHTINLPKQDI